MAHFKKQVKTLLPENKTRFDPKIKYVCYLYVVVKQLNPILLNWRPAVQ